MGEMLYQGSMHVQCVLLDMEVECLTGRTDKYWH